MDPVVLALAVVIGIAAGVASGMFGVGGGIIIVPALLYLVPGTTFLVAKAASLLVMVVATGLGVMRHRARGSVELGRGVVLGLFGAAGAAVAVLLAEGLADAVLRAGFGLFLTATGIRMMRPVAPRSKPIGRATDLVLTALTGFLAGVIAGFFGVGGGILMVPTMTLAGLPIHTAVGTSLVAVLLNAIAGTLTHLELGYWADIWRLSIPLALGALAGSWFGVSLAHRLEAVRLRRYFAVFLVLVGVWMGIDAVVLGG